MGSVILRVPAEDLNFHEECYYAPLRTCAVCVVSPLRLNGLCCFLSAEAGSDEEL